MVKKIIVLDLPYPPTVNHYYGRGKRGVYLLQTSAAYRVAVAAIVARKRIKPLTVALDIFIEVYPPDKRRRDIDNLLKSLLDALQHAGVYVDDGQIDCLTIEKECPVPEGHVVVTVMEE